MTTTPTTPSATQTPRGSFDESLTKTASELDEAATEVLDDIDVKKALEDGDRDDAW